MLRLFVIHWMFVAAGFAALPSVEQVLRQNGDGFPKTWGTRNGAPVQADYEMDPEITGDPKYRDLIAPALRSLPSLLITMPNEDLFGEAHGIYSHPLESGQDWERAAQITLIGTNHLLVFDLQCGIQIHGGWNRRPEESPKHAFRLLFKKKYGAGKLKAPLFGPSAAAEFDTLVLRAGCNNTWLHWRTIERQRGDFLRDQWMRDTHRAMGQLAAHGIFVHVYLNGLYWGLYNLTERPDESFASEYLRGGRKDFDARNSDKILSGDPAAWNELMRRVNAEVKTAADFHTVSELLDIEKFADFMLLNLYGANADWDRSSNWYAARPRRTGGKFIFFVWDAERTLEEANDDTLSFDDDQSPARIFQRLRENETFRQLFSQHAKKHLAGALAPEAAADRYRKLAQQSELAVICESARWGDYRRDLHPYRQGPFELYTPKHWRNEVSRLLHSYFPARTKVLIGQLQRAQLYAD